MRRMQSGNIRVPRRDTAAMEGDRQHVMAEPQLSLVSTKLLGP
jgi:hypothetical protein